MRRRLFHISAIISLLMFGLVVLFWGRSYSHTDKVEWNRQPRCISVISDHGKLTLSARDGSNGNFSDPPGWHANFWPFRKRYHPAFEVYTGVNWQRSFKFYYDEHYRFGGGRLLYVLAPHWFLATLFALVPLISLYRWIRNRKRNPFACLTCGYDLRATPDRCPECGAVVVQKLS